MKTPHSNGYLWDDRARGPEVPEITAKMKYLLMLNGLGRELARDPRTPKHDFVSQLHKATEFIVNGSTQPKSALAALMQFLESHEDVADDLETVLVYGLLSN